MAGQRRFGRRRRCYEWWEKEKTEEEKEKNEEEKERDGGRLEGGEGEENEEMYQSRWG